MNEALLAVKEVTKYFGGLKALDQVNFEVNTGEILGLIGPNGAGKTVCFNLISGVYAASSGKIVFNGRRTDGSSGCQSARSTLLAAPSGILNYQKSGLPGNRDRKDKKD